MKVFGSKASRKPSPKSIEAKPAWRILLVGGGSIAQTHAAAIRTLPGREIAGVLDTNEKQAEKFANTYNIRTRYTSPEAALAEGQFHSAHILTPPPSHKDAAYPFLEAGIPCFIEKPMAQSGEECWQLRQAATGSGAAVRVNQNFVFHPAHQKLKRAVLADEIGPLREIQCRFAMPLRQLTARQFGHWMFDSPLNLLLEQAVHPLSQLDDLAGPLKVKSAHARPGNADGGETGIATQWQISLSGSNSNTLISLTVLLGAKFPQWQISALGDDGVMAADYLTNSVIRDRPGAYLDSIDHFRRDQGMGFARIWQSSRGLITYAGSQVKLIGRRDSFYLSIRNSMDAFYRDIDGGGTNLNAEQGERLVTLCEAIVRQAGRERPRASTPEIQQKKTEAPPDAVILGGTGFIGRALVKQMVAQGKSVRVLARHVANLDPIYQHHLVEVVRASIADEAALTRALKHVPVVVNLAHGGGGETYAQIYEALVDGACRVAMAVDPQHIKKLLFISSIAALYLGKDYGVISGITGVDKNRQDRGDYARAKAEAELKLLQLYREEGIPVSIFRPGIVVGDGTSPFHSGVGLYNRERVCLGWNMGENPLPFVLVEDVATALMQAAFDVHPNELNGKAFNLIGDVRLTARRYTDLLARTLGRPLVFRPQRLIGQHAIELCKYLIKRVAGRKVPVPSLHDLRSRGMPAWFDTSFEKTTLGWYPDDSIQTFIQQAMSVHKD